MIASITATFALAGAVVWLMVDESFSEGRLIRAASYGNRPIAGRLTRFVHTPLSTKRGVRREAAPTRLDAAAGRILAGQFTPHLRGRAALLTGQTSDAVVVLRTAAKSPEERSDLAAALVEEATTLDAYDPALDAVVEARAAIAAKPAFVAAHFNLALALQRLGLTAEARSEFEKAAALEPGSAWAAESRQRAKEIGLPADWRPIDQKVRTTKDSGVRRALIQSDVEHARRHAEGPYLLEWAQARLENRPEDARNLLDLLRTIGRVSAEVSNDQLIADTVVVIDAAEKQGNVAARELAQAHAMYGQGRLALNDSDATKGIRLLDQAARDLSRLRSPIQYVAKYYTAGALYEALRADEVQNVIASLDREGLEAKGYLSLAAQLDWERGISHVVQGSYAEALQAFDRGYTNSMTYGNREQAAAFDGLASEALEYLGESREAWSRRARALTALSSFRSNFAQRSKTSTLRGAANLQIAARRFGRANAILEYTIADAVRMGNPVVLANALAQRAVARAELRDGAGAASDRAAASRMVARIPDPVVRARLQVDVDVAEGVAKRVTSPKAAIVHFTTAIDSLRRSGQSALLPRLYVERARAYEAAGDVAHVRQDLRAVLDVIAGWEKAIRDTEQRAAISVWSDASRRELISLELGQKDVGAAFSYADARRTAAPRDDSPPAAQARMSHIEVQRALAPNAAIIEFVTTGDALIVFIIRSNDVRAVTLPARVARIAAVAEAMRKAEDEELKQAAGALYALVIAPIRHRLTGVTTLAVIPDRELTGISFGALYDPARNRFLMEEIAVVHDPTASGAIEWSRQAQPARDRTMVAIGASVFDRREYPDAAALSAVDPEADTIARLFPNARRLLGAAATPSAVQREIAVAAVVHYAGHIVGRGADARLLLAPSEGRNSLTARDIGALHLDKTRVVVLAACRGSGTNERHAIVQDMASAFLTAGVPTVVASATDVDDREAPETMRRLHGFLARGDDAADALRKTVQLDRKEGKPVPLSIRLLVMGGSRLLVR